MSHVCIRKRTVVIGISTTFEYRNSREVDDVTIRERGFSVRGGGSFLGGS